VILSLSRPRDLRAIYNKGAAGWQRRIAALGYPDAYLAALDDFLPAGWAAPRVLDAGCGAGDFAAAYLLRRGRPALLTLADPAASMLLEAEARLKNKADEILLLEATLDDLPEYPAQDLILCAHAIDHCPDPVQALRRLAQSLTRHGALVVIATKPHWCTWITRRLWHHHSHSPDRMLQAIAAAGLVCRRDMGFAKGPPQRTSHAYLITHTQPELCLC
jgi:ubiquinone/menaquinone biosynthesis C-methylase UbiE